MSTSRLLLIFCSGTLGECADTATFDWTDDFADPDSHQLLAAVHAEQVRRGEEWRFVCALRSDTGDCLASAASLGYRLVDTPYFATLCPIDFPVRSP